MKTDFGKTTIPSLPRKTWNVSKKISTPIKDMIKIVLFLFLVFTTITSFSAKLYFNDIYKASGNSYTIQPSSLDNIT
ncbi:MAG: hypothetical protein ACK5A2_13365, partial [Bacteroidota bacterium]